MFDSVILDDKTPPPKPPRGNFRYKSPMKPQRGVLRIEPLPNGDDNKENASTSTRNSQFKATDVMAEMQRYFKRSVEVMRNSAEFTGAEAADILEAYITSHKECFKREDVGRKNAILVLDLWRKESFLRPVVGDTTKKFEDCDRTFYMLCGVENDTALFYANSPMSSSKYGDDNLSSVNRTIRSSRSNSFKKMFSPFVRRNRSNSRSRTEKEKEKENSILKSTWSVFSMSDRNEKKAKQAAEQLVKEEEVEIYHLALVHLLTVVEVEFLEDFAAPTRDLKKNASFLSSILEKMGISSANEGLDAREEDEMDLLIETHPLMRTASTWFQMARLCAPMLYLEASHGKSNVMQMYLWSKAALVAVTERLDKITNNATSPLFPNEFSSLLTSIATQLINDMESGEKLNLAILYIFLMVPVPLRETIDNLIQWLQLTLRTNAVEDLRSPYYLGPKEPRNKENCKVIIDEIRGFFFPKGCMTNAQMDIFIETLIELRSDGRLGKYPESMADSLRAKLVLKNAGSLSARRGRGIMRSNSEKKTNGGDITPVRYAIDGSESLRMKSSRKDYVGLEGTEVELVKMMEVYLDDKKASLTDKKKRLAAFSKQYPELYKRFFKGML